MVLQAKPQPFTRMELDRAMLVALLIFHGFQSFE
jgi:hypothetical protein